MKLPAVAPSFLVALLQRGHAVERDRERERERDGNGDAKYFTMEHVRM